jgi:GT2 family glycosyltransferase
VSHGTADLLDRCLSALPAALGDLRAEVVVVDNASPDDSVAVARGHEGVRVVANDTNEGYARAMNVALAGAVADVLIALNPDTVPAPGSLAVLATAVASDPAVGLAVPQLHNPDGTLQPSVHRFPSVAVALAMGFLPPPARTAGDARLGRRFWLEDAAPHDRRETVDWAIGAVHAIRRRALPDPDHVYTERWFMYAEDMDLCWRLHCDGWGVLLVPDAEVMHVANAAGAVVWGDDRDRRWLDATYDWYRSARGPVRAHAFALANLAGLGAKWATFRVSGRRAQADAVARLLALHRAQLRGGAGPAPS